MNDMYALVYFEKPNKILKYIFCNYKYFETLNVNNNKQYNKILNHFYSAKRNNRTLSSVKFNNLILLNLSNLKTLKVQDNSIEYKIISLYKKYIRLKKINNVLKN